MDTNIEQRACDLAVYIIKNKTTVRSSAKEFGISKSTVHTVKKELGIAAKGGVWLWHLIDDTDSLNWRKADAKL